MKKKDVLIIRIEPELKALLEKRAKKLDIPASEIVRDAIKKALGFKEKPIV